MIKSLKVMLCVLMILFLTTGCELAKINSDRLTIIVTNFPAYDFARAIAGDIADIQMLLQPGAESHTYDPTPRDIINIGNADMFIYTGGDSDSLITKMLSNVDTNVKIVKMMELTNLVEKTQIRANESRYDEHVWTSPINAIKLVEGIRDMLIEIDKVNEETYTINASTYIEQMKELDKEIKEVIENSSNKELIFGDRFPFIYFTTEYDLKYSAAYPGCATQSEPSIGTITHLMNRVKEQEIPVILYIESSDRKIAENIAAQTGAKLLMMHSAHNVTAEEFQNGVTYITLMRNNLDSLREALN